MSDEQIEILENLIKYLQFKIDAGEHKIIYDDLMNDEKVIDCINSLNDLIKVYKELEEENTDLKDLYIRTAKHQEKIGHEELAGYMLAQIEAVPTFTTWEEYKTWINKQDFRKILDKYEHKEIKYAPEMFEELKKLLEE